MPPGFFSFQSFGTLSFFVSQPAAFPVTVDPHFATPYSRSLTFGFQHQLTNNLVFSADFYHKGIENILDIRETNLPFEARIDGSGALLTPVNGFGPWYSGLYNAGIFSFQKRMSHHFLLGGSYTFAAENDNALCAQLAVSSESAQNCYSTDSFQGVVPVVTDPGGPGCAGGTNSDAPFFACSGSFVPKAGAFYNGANLDSGPSGLCAPPHLRTSRYRGITLENPAQQPFPRAERIPVYQLCLGTCRSGWQRYLRRTRPQNWAQRLYCASFRKHGLACGQEFCGSRTFPDSSHV